MPVKPIPEGYHNVTPYVAVRGADRFIEFLKQAFGAQEKERHTLRDGRVMHAEVKIGDSIIMLGEANERWQPKPTTFYLYVEDIDSTYRRALGVGATSATEPANQFWGDRTAMVMDPAGNSWFIATHVEDISREELERRFKEQIKKAA
jgi:uncharacterized glyoxalase superfamily protein PhnB